MTHAEPPPALPPEAYRLMATATPTLPPVTAHFNYRPAGEPDGKTRKPGWDLVSLQLRGGAARGRSDITRMIDAGLPVGVQGSRRTFSTIERCKQPASSDGTRPRLTVDGRARSEVAQRADLRLTRGCETPLSRRPTACDPGRSGSSAGITRGARSSSQ